MDSGLKILCKRKKLPLGELFRITKVSFLVQDHSAKEVAFFCLDGIEVSGTIKLA